MVAAVYRRASLPTRRIGVAMSEHRLLLRSGHVIGTEAEPIAHSVPTC